MPDLNVNNAASVIDAMERLHEPRAIRLVDQEFGPIAYAVPKGVSVQSIKTFVDEWRARPERKKGTARIEALESLIAHVNRFKTKHSAAFAAVNRTTPLIAVVYDYHEGHAEVVEGKVTVLGAPDWCQHRAVYTFPMSDEWLAWNNAIEPMQQSAFAAFIEDRIGDVQDPGSASAKVTDYMTTLGLELASPAKLMAVSRGLAVRVEQKVSQAINLTTGEGQLVFEEEHKDAQSYGPMKVPGAFAIAIPVFKNGAPYSIPVRLRYRLHDRKILWWLSLANADLYLQHAINEACTKFTEETAVPLYYGAPEQG